jgi:solute carrier family 35 (adenosine 3'-phospho 5'-phosphosulfate transporter), member B3
MLGNAFRATTSAFESQLSSSAQFAVLVAGVFLFFGIHNYLQEAIMNVPGFEYGVMLGYFEVIGVAVCSFIERQYIVKEFGRKAPLSAFPLLTVCLLSSSALSNMSLNYINFPTKVVFRSCKLIPTMLIASVLHKKIFTSIEYACAIAACAGLVMFAAADWEFSPTFHPVGLLLVSLSVCADAVLPNAQEGLFKMGSSRLEVTLYTNVFTLSIMTLSTLASGDLVAVLRQMGSNRKLTLYFAIYTFVAYIAISFHMNVVKRYGGVASVLVATGRKAMTLILSFVLFPKGYSWFYPVGAVLVLGGLLVASLTKMQSSGTMRKNAISAGNGHHQELPRHEKRPLKEHASDVSSTPPPSDGVPVARRPSADAY